MPINYHYLRAAKIIARRSTGYGAPWYPRSPIFEAVRENCLRFLDKETMNALAPGLEGTIKSAVGMPTKIGCSRILASSAMRHAADFETHAPRFLQLMEKQLLDRNDEASQSYARSAAYLIRVASAEAQQRFVDRLIGLYLNLGGRNTEREGRRCRSRALENLPRSVQCAGRPDPAVSCISAKHDTNEGVAKEFDEVWGKHTGSLSVIRYIPEIVDLVKKTPDTTQWALIACRATHDG